MDVSPSCSWLAPGRQSAELPPTRPSSLLGEGSESAEAGLGGGLSTAALTAAAPDAVEQDGASAEAAAAAAGAELVETAAAVADVAEGLVAGVQAACAASPAQQPVLPAQQPAAAMAPPRSRDPRQRRKQAAPARVAPSLEGRTFGLLAVPVPPELDGSAGAQGLWPDAAGMPAGLPQAPLPTPSGGPAASQQLYAKPQPPQPAQHDGRQAGQGWQAAICCSHCGSTYTSNGWDKHPHTGERLCHACGQYANMHGGQLPRQELLLLREERRQQAQQRALAAEEEEEEEWRPPQQQQQQQQQQQPQQPLPNRQPQPQRPRQLAQQRRCLVCGSTSPGPWRTASWCRHPVTRQEWVCGPCYNKAYSQRKKEEARQAALEAAEEEEQEEREEGEEEGQPSQPGEAQQGGRKSLRLLQQHASHLEPALTAAAHTHNPRTAAGRVAALVAAEAAAEAWSSGTDGGWDVGGNQPPPGPDSWEPAVAGGSQQLAQAAEAEGQQRDGEQDEGQVHEAEQPGAKAAARRCLRCGSHSPGSWKSAKWCRHPVTRQEWVCSSCYANVRRQLKRERARLEKAQQQAQQAKQAQQGEEAGQAALQAPLQQPAMMAWEAAGAGGTLAAPAQDTAGGMGGGSGGEECKEGTAGLVARLLRAAGAAVVKEEQQEAPSEPAPKRLRLHPATPSTIAAPAIPPATASGTPTAPPASVAQQLHQLPLPPQPGPQPDLFTLLLDAADVAAAAAGGLTPELAGSFMALLDLLPPEQQAAKEARLRLLLAQHQYSAAAGFLATSLRLAGA